MQSRSEVFAYMRLGVTLVNQHTDLNDIFKAWPKARTVILHVCRPHAEVEAFVPSWLRRYADGALKDGAVAEEPFTLYLDTAKPEKYQLALEVGQKVTPTVQTYLSEGTFWEIAGRVSSIYTVYITGRPIVVKSVDKVELRDMAHLDTILELVHKSLSARGIDLASVVRPGA